MEVNTTILIETDNNKLAEFIYSMWDLQTQPLDEDMAPIEFRKIYEDLEFEDLPSWSIKQDNRLLAYFDCMDGTSVLGDVLNSYKNCTLTNMIIAIESDEGKDWHQLAGKKLENISASSKTGKYFQDLIENILQNNKFDKH